ncbi:MAG: RsmD family RNA methyltransferase [Lentimonas sp.]
MRITGGKAGGIQLKTPKGDNTRPATDRMRESIFSSLGPSVKGCSVVDLFAGTGSYGLEALSRGACAATFYETDRSALTCLRQNTQAVLRSCGLNMSSAKVIARDIYSLDVNPPAYDLIFCDPPYDVIEQHLPRIFEKAVDPIALPVARVIVELPGNLEPNIQGWELIKRLGKTGKGKPTIAIFQRV